MTEEEIPVLDEAGGVVEAVEDVMEVDGLDLEDNDGCVQVGKTSVPVCCVHSSKLSLERQG